MGEMGVKTAATCDTIDGLSVKESAPPPGGKRHASLLAPRLPRANPGQKWESAGPVRLRSSRLAASCGSLRRTEAGRGADRRVSRPTDHRLTARRSGLLGKPL